MYTKILKGEKMIVTAYSPVNYYKNNYVKQNHVKHVNCSADTVSFSGSRLTKAQRTKLVAQLTEKMQNRPETSKKLYQYAIDFVNNKLSKENFIKNMYELLNNGFEDLNDNEAGYVCNYGIAFNRSGADPKRFTKKSITGSFDSLRFDV